MPIIDAPTLRILLRYDLETGDFTWLKPLSNRVKVGAKAGSITSYGYLSIRVLGKSYLAHRLAWLYMHGAWPKGEVDHKDGVKTNNCAGNLRDVPGAVNRQNIRQAKVTSRSGTLGVHWLARRRKWAAKITTNRVQKSIGYFDDKASAHAAYLSANRQQHEGCTL